MITPAREQRRARDRAISVVLAIVIGFILGIGGWLVARDKTPDAPVPVAAAKDRSDTKTDGIVLAPHKALYDVTLSSARNGSQIINIQGRMFFQLHQGCDGYITDHRFALTYDYADSEPMRVTSDFSTVENLDGTHFDFSSRRRRGGEIYQELRGKADKPHQDDGAVVYQEPGDLNFALPGGTLFPAAHTRALIKAARSGKKFFATTVFDGSDDEGPVDVTAIIGPARDATGDAPTGLGSTASARAMFDDDLLKSKAWTVRLAFFPRKSESETSDYELTMRLHENGVISNMKIAYQDFTVEQKLVALEPVDPETCGKRAETTKPGQKSAENRVEPPVPDLPLR